MASGKTRFTPLGTATHGAPWSFLFSMNPTDADIALMALCLSQCRLTAVQCT